MSTLVETISPTQIQSARARKRQRQKKNQRFRASGALDDALRALTAYPTLAHSFRAWLCYLQLYGTPQEHRSATNFARVFQHEIIQSAHNIHECEQQFVTPDLLSFTIHEFAGSFILDKNIERPSKIARIGCNLCSYIFFLGKYNILPFSEVQKLHDYCVDLGSSMIRSARAERIGEEYSSFVRKCYLNTEAVENVSLFNGGFEVAYCGKRFCLLKDWSESGLDHNAFREVDPVKVRFPSPMTKQLKPGDHLHLEIRRIAGSSIWVPTECYGVYPEGADDDEYRNGPSSTPTERSERAKTAQDEINQLLTSYQKTLTTAYEQIQPINGDDPTTEHLTQRLAELDTTLGQVRSEFTWNRQFAERCVEDLLPDDFDESRYTDFYFASMEIDIGDDDKGFGVFEEASDLEYSDGDETP